MNYGDIAGGYCQYSGIARGRDARRNRVEQRHAEDESMALALCCIHCGDIDINHDQPCSYCPGPCCFFCQLDDHDENETTYYYGDRPHQLFSVCSLLYKECTRLFYSRVALEVIYTAPAGFSSLQRMGPLVIASLRDLTIRLNLCFCLEGPACTRQDHRIQSCYSVCRIGGHDEPLGKRPGSRNDRYARQHLRDVCMHLGRFAPAHQLNLTFVCEVVDHGLAAKLADALQQLPPLRSCTISFSRVPDPYLRTLAQDTRLRLTDPTHRFSRHFRLRDLPREIQLHVLRHSGLIAPFHVSFDPRVNQPAAKRYECVYGYEIGEFETIPVMCCCTHGTSASSAGACSHWRFPNALFLVDRQMETDARAIMYSENCWVVRKLNALVAALDSGLPQSHPGPPPAVSRMGANLAQFFSRLRQVQILLPHRIPSSAELRDAWLVGARRLFEKCVPERLNLTLLLPHPTHRAGNLEHFLSSQPWRDQKLVVGCMLAGLRERGNLQNLSVGFERDHIDMSDDGYPYNVECGVGETLDRLEAQFEDAYIRETRPLADTRGPGALRIPPKIHACFQSNRGYECLVCGLLRGNSREWVHDYQHCLLSYHD
ncbi:hypothetical protein B0H67DRAFT_566980 [Lasiosphaeris hirsuta]|uniref:Uncharacterized protein n=1 Tax=Lasiosphaeris hirsuta TaxID=260670 RepID=A0AA40BDN4_9PEZI|nr:hypothetical protein B0H67DRAFT_566980 [Lasiosphaeris hirsuta]